MGVDKLLGACYLLECQVRDSAPDGNNPWNYAGFLVIGDKLDPLIYR